VSKLKTEHTKKLLTSFAKGIIEQAKKILKAKKKDVSGKLLKSLKYKIKEDKNGLNLSFQGAKHANFIDKGVSGKEKRQYFKDLYNKRRQSPFRYKSKKPPASAFDKWAVRVGLAPRSKTGKFISRKSLQFALRETIYKRGIASTSFFSNSVYTQYKKFRPKILSAFKQDLIQQIKQMETPKI